jgi:hypothetical protein
MPHRRFIHGLVASGASTFYAYANTSKGRHNVEDCLDWSETSTEQ